MLECCANGGVSVGKLLDDEDGRNVRIISFQGEKDDMDKALADFVQDPLAYDLHEMVPDEDMREMALDCEKLRKELCALAGAG